MGITEIALTVGYRNLSYSNRRFRARFGLCPRQYRATHPDRRFGR
ncbi:MAG: helix-turn-helix domain-containing protein [Planctomycetes bacterium]|nr:helix-turn-helix domain-containing protein [Planctomycetota bacterium]